MTIRLIRKQIYKYRLVQ